MLNNWLKTGVLLASLTALMLAIGNKLAGKEGMFFSLFLAAIINFTTYWFSDNIILAMYNAKEIKNNENQELITIVDQLTKKIKLPCPRLYIIDNKIPNAFATGRNPNNSTIAVTSGILAELNNNELKAVIAHELSHIRNRDTLVNTITATIAGALGILANWSQWLYLANQGKNKNNKSSGISSFIIITLAPIIATLIQLAISRSREFAADNEGAQLCENPVWLASALMKLDNAMHNNIFYIAEGNPTTAHLFIVNPLQSKMLLRLFSTHPPMKERIKKLYSMVAVT